MTERVIGIEDLRQAKKELQAIGCDKAGIDIMAPKGIYRVIKISGVKPAPANIIKQEMLAIGGEAATAYGAIDQSVAETDLLIFGNLKQFDFLIEKLKLHQFGLPWLAERIKAVLENYTAVPKPLALRGQTFHFGERTYVMGILNVTPDSFSDGGKFTNADDAVAYAKKMLADGADIIDVGGESTRPGAESISSEEEKKRVLPVIERLAEETGAAVSIDTNKADVARAAVSAGAGMVNDISCFRFDPKMADVIAAAKVPVCVMHIQGKPRDMQVNPVYSDLMKEVINYLDEGLAIANKAGILLDKIIVDPGIGFGKTVEHNLDILKKLRELKVLGCPILIGPSRKSFIGKSLDLPVEERLEGTAAAVALSIANGADIIRVHDVKEMARVAKMADAISRLR